MVPLNSKILTGSCRSRIWWFPWTGQTRWRWRGQLLPLRGTQPHCYRWTGCGSPDWVWNTSISQWIILYVETSPVLPALSMTRWHNQAIHKRQHSRHQQKHCYSMAISRYLEPWQRGTWSPWQLPSLFAWLWHACVRWKEVSMRIPSLRKWALEESGISTLYILKTLNILQCNRPMANTKI